MSRARILLTALACFVLQNLASFHGGPTTVEAAANDSTAYSVATAGDVNGDGRSDFIVGSPGANGSEGRVDVYLGTATGSPFLQRTLVSGEPGSSFGAAVSPAGDVNGDGYDDILIGQPRHKLIDGVRVGQVWIFHGGPAGIPATPALKIEGVGATYWQFGSSVARGGNLNGDAYDDIVVGAPAANFGASDIGAAFVYYGSAAGVVAASPLMLRGWAEGGQFGYAVAGVGDVEADGYDDLVVTAPQPVAFLRPGRVLRYRGGPSGLSTAPTDSVVGTLANTQFGYSAAPAGDYNGDGYADVVVGEPLADDAGFTDTGKAYLVRGSSSGFVTTPVFLVAGEGNTQGLGFSVACAGDVNGDGLGDIVAGIPWDNGGLGANQGRAILMYGVSFAVGNKPLAIAGFKGPSGGAYYGSSVTGVGDLQADGFSDWMVGAFGTASGGTFDIRSGGPALGARLEGQWSTAPTENGGERLGISVGGGGDVNGDGLDDGLVGGPGVDASAGLAYVFTGRVSASVIGLSNAAIQGSGPGVELGMSVAIAGDVDGDGYDDAILGAPGTTVSGALQAGVAELHRGSSTGLQVPIAWTLPGSAANGRWGTAVSGVGDLNRDGYADVAVGSLYDATNGARAGRVAIHLGGPAGPAAAPVLELFGTAAGESLGVAIAGAGDINGDGFDDAVVGAPGYAGRVGRVLVVYGSATPPFAVTSLVSDLSAGSNFGRSVAGRADIDGDGYGELAVGAPTGLAGRVGAVKIYRGGVTGPIVPAIQTLAGGSPDSAFGRSLSWGDLTADGRSDLVVGSLGTYENPGGVGYVDVFLDSAGTLVASSHLTRPIPGGRGTAVDARSDFNGDGFADIMLGNAFNVYYTPQVGGVELASGGGSFPGVERKERMRRLNDSAPDALESRVTSTNLRIRARSAAGRQPVNVEHQFGPLGTPFSALPILGTGFALPGPVDGSRGVYLDVSKLITPLPGEPMRWRMRVRGHFPWIPTTPWLTPSGNAVTQTDVVGAPGSVAVDPGSVLPDQLMLAAPAPNPAHGGAAVTLACTLPVAGQFTLSIHDVSGRVVRVLERGIRAAGPVRHAWDGRNDAGHETPSGVYFVRASLAGSVVTNEFVRIR